MSKFHLSGASGCVVDLDQEECTVTATRWAQGTVLKPSLGASGCSGAQFLVNQQVQELQDHGHRGLRPLKNDSPGHWTGQTTWASMGDGGR